MHGHNGFPTIKTIDDVLPHIEGRTDFAVKKGDGYTAIDYIFAGPDTFDHPIRRECRGIKFGADGKIIGRPFHKFFNLGEKPETQPAAVNWAVPHVALEKLDGSMVHPAMVHGDLVWMTRAGITDIAMDAERHATKHQMLTPCHSLLASGLTPIFEWCSPRNQIVIRYPEDRLVLTGVRDMVSGDYLPLWSYAFDAVREYSANIDDLAAFIAHTRGLKDQEGYVVRFNTGAMLKIKAEDYVLKHKARDSILLEKNVLRIVLEGKTDDVTPLLSAEDGNRLRVYDAIIQDRLYITAGLLARIVAEAQVNGLDRKAFATTVVNESPAIWKAPLFNIWQGSDPAEAVRQTLLKHCRSQADIDAIRHIIGAEWNIPAHKEAA